MSDDQRNALNAMLFHTGTQSKDFVLVLAALDAEAIRTPLFGICSWAIPRFNA